MNFIVTVEDRFFLCLTKENHLITTTFMGEKFMQMGMAIDCATFLHRMYPTLLIGVGSVT